jgi:Skp family chaperone for outer membrane proteins
MVMDVSPPFEKYSIYSAGVLIVFVAVKRVLRALEREEQYTVQLEALIKQERIQYHNIEEKLLEKIDLLRENNALLQVSLATLQERDKRNDQTIAELRVELEKLNHRFES